MNTDAHRLLRPEVRHRKSEGRGLAPEQLADADLALRFLVDTLTRGRELALAQKTDCLGLIAAPPASRYPRFTEFKNQGNLACINRRLREYEWLLANHRPWMRYLKRHPASTTQPQNKIQ